MLILGHKNLRVWRLSVLLYRDVLQLVKLLPRDEIFVIGSQIRRAALSVCNNIAEGAARRSALERRRFYEIARSSSVEVDCCLEVILCVNYLSQDDIRSAEKNLEEVFKMLSAMIVNTK